MKKLLLSATLLLSLFAIQSCKDPEPEPGINFSGRLLTECDNPAVVANTSLELWEDERNGDTSKARFIMSTNTDPGGYFLFRHTFDSVPMSLRLKGSNGNYIYLAKGIFGIFQEIQTFNNVVADVLQKGNKANVNFELIKPGNWQTGDSVVISLKDPAYAGGYVSVFNEVSPNQKVVNNIRAFTRMMEFENNKTELNRKFCFELLADWHIGGQKINKSYWVPTSTCKGDSLHTYQLKF